MDLPEKSRVDDRSKPLKMSEEQKQFEQVWKDIQVAYEEHRIDLAYRMSRQFSSQHHESRFTTLSQKQKELLETIEIEYENMIDFYKQFDSEGWIFDKQEKGVKLQYKMYEEEKQIAIKIEGQFDVPVENFLAIVCEIELMGDYVPFCFDSRMVKWISRNERIGTSKIYVPMLTDRQTYFYATGYDRLKQTNSIFFYSMTVNDNLEHQKRYGYDVPRKSDLVRLEYKFFIIEYIPVGKNRAKVRLASNVDLKLNFLPKFILSISARKFAFDYFKNIMKINEKFKGSEWEKKVKENPKFYGFFQRKNQEYLQEGRLL